MQPTLLRYAVIFFIAFILNAAWEHAHAVLYVHYKGAAITTGILLRAAMFDASVITLAAFLFLTVPFLHDRLWLLPVVLTIFAVGLEWWALGTGRWAYRQSMPLIPILGVGITPSVQLGLLGHLSLLLSGLLA